MDVTVRRGTIEDAPGVTDVVNSIVAESGLIVRYPAVSLEEEIVYIQHLGPRSAFFVAEAGDRILGVQTIEPFAPQTQAMDHVAVIGTYVHRDLRRRGAGLQLFQSALDFARQRAYEKLIVYVRIGNSVAQAFYRRVGFIPKMMLERQIKIDGRYDDAVWMEMFIPAAVTAPQPQAAPASVCEEPEPAAALVAEPAPAVVVETPAPEPAPAPVLVAESTVAVDPTVGAVSIRRAKRRDVQTLAAIMKGTMRWRTSPAEEEVLEMLFDKGYWLAMSRKGGGLTGWRAENLVMCIDDFYVYPAQYYPQVGAPLLETVETEAKALSCEVAIVFLDDRIAPQAVAFFEAHGYERQQLEDLFSVWREVAQEFLSDHTLMLVKKLREKRIMRPM